MAVRFDSASTDALRLSSGIFDYNSTYTVMAWVYPVSNPAADMQPFAIGANGSNVDRLRTGAAATAWSSQSIIGGTSATSATSAISYATWQHLTMVRSSVSALDLYVNGTLIGSASQSVSGRTAATQLDTGNGIAGSTPMNGRIAAIKIWTAALTAAEILQEQRSIRPVKLASLWAFWPAFPGTGQRTRDYSGNGRTFTEVGTLTDENPPPVGWGAPSTIVPFAGRTVRFSGTAASASTTPNTPALRVSRKVSGTAGSQSTTPNTPALRVSRKVSGTAGSQSTTPNTPALRVSRKVSGTAGSQSTTPNTARLLSVVRFSGTAASQSTTPNTSVLRVLRHVVGALSSQSTTPTIAFVPELRALLDHTLRLPARRQRFALSDRRLFVAPALRRSFKAHLMAVAEIPKDPEEELDFTIDYTDLLSGDPIATSTWTIDTGDAVVSAQSNTTTSTSVRCKLGTLNTKSKVKNVVISSGGQKVVRRLVLILQEM